MDEQLAKTLEENDYFFLKEIPERGICGISRMLFTVGLVYGLNEVGYEGRYCYPNSLEALVALQIWDGRGDPPGPWIKHKGRVEYSNPNKGDDI